MFTTDNTEGQYTAAQLATMNARASELMADGMDEQNACEIAQREFDNAQFA